MSEVTIVQLTDTHIRAAGERVHGTVDTFANLTHVLHQLRASHREIGAIVFSGDLADDGSPEAYRRLRDAVEPVAAELGARVLYAPGNHDERAAFGAELLGAADARTDQVTEVAGLRIVVLDSSVPGLHHGELTDDQLDRLRGVLREPAPHGTLLVLHHPPIPSALPVSQLLRLRQPERLAEVLRGTDVRLIVCGHSHLTAASALAGIPVWVGPATSFRQDSFAPVGRQRGFAAFGYSRIDVVGESLVVTAVEATPAEVLYERDEQATLDQLAALAAEAR
ncbi:metallophosphoesterase [Nocardia sp. NPDC057353]|uniref:metallophosphoesterase n=1 Tax=Nocardia sp. NPDC057353 TaxID=3346104 RepID=UPI0036358F09